MRMSVCPGCGDSEGPSIGCRAQDQDHGSPNWVSVSAERQLVGHAGFDGVPEPEAYHAQPGDRAGWSVDTGPGRTLHALSMNRCTTHACDTDSPTSAHAFIAGSKNCRFAAA